MKLARQVLISAAVAVALWTVFFWPVPRFAATGIPAGYRAEKHCSRLMMASDSLQMLYHFWLAADMVRGRTPLFSNLYEFNFGDDAERRQPDAFYAPISLVFALFFAAGGQAFGYNMTALAAIWLTYLFTWRLLARLARDEWIAALAALAGTIFPYRMITLAHGSPTGFAILWVPAFLLGLREAVVDLRLRGGMLAGVCVLFAAFTDTHVFYFLVLAAPAWFIACIAARCPLLPDRPADWIRLGSALLPAAVCAALAACYGSVQARHLGRTVMAQGRRMREVLIFSPEPSGLWSWTDHGPSGHVFVGIAIPVFLAVGFCVLAARASREPRAAWRTLAALCATLVAAALVTSLALGPRGPRQGWIYNLFRAHVPFYDMIRQTAKAYVLMPTLVAMAAAWAVKALAGAGRSRAWRIGLPLVFAAAAFVEYKRHFSATFCVLDSEQGAYRAVAEDAARTGAPPRALAVVLWPGDSHWSTECLYYASLYRIRMVNGYSPKVALRYYDEVFSRFQSVNQGWLSDQQAQDLLRRGIRYITVHEDLFPEKVSPFPVGATLSRFMRDPRMRLLAKDRSVWAFELLDKPQDRPGSRPAFDSGFPARWWEFERHCGDSRLCAADPGASAGGFAILRDEAWATTPPVAVAPDIEARFALRLRGHGSLRARQSADGAVLDTRCIEVECGDWAWFEVPLAARTGFQSVRLRLDAESGSIAADMAQLRSGSLPRPEPGSSIEWPAAAFFHAGYTDPDSGAVVLRAARDPESVVLYGPKLPLPEGRYMLELAFGCDAAPGTVLGGVNIQWQERVMPLWREVQAGVPFSMQFRQATNLPWFFVFLYSRNADMRIEKAVLTRID